MSVYLHHKLQGQTTQWLSIQIPLTILLSYSTKKQKRPKPLRVGLGWVGSSPSGVLTTSRTNILYTMANGKTNLSTKYFYKTITSKTLISSKRSSDAVAYANGSFTSIFFWYIYSYPNEFCFPFLFFLLSHGSDA